MSTLATQPTGLLEIPNGEPSVEQMVRLAMPPRTEPLSETDAEIAAFKEDANTAQKIQLAELEQTVAGVSPSITAIRRLILEVAHARERDDLRRKRHR